MQTFSGPGRPAGGGNPKKPDTRQAGPASTSAIPESTLRQVLEYLPQSTPTLSARPFLPLRRPLFHFPDKTAAHTKKVQGNNPPRIAFPTPYYIYMALQGARQMDKMPSTSISSFLMGLSLLMALQKGT